MLEANSAFTDLVKAGNRIKFTGTNRDPIKREVASAGLPEVRIIMTGSTPHPGNTSASSRDTVTFEVQVSSGDQRLDAVHLPLRWVIFRALAGAYTALGTIEWNSKAFVKNVLPQTVGDGVSDADLNRGIQGWSAVWAVEIDCWFDTSDL